MLYVTTRNKKETYTSFKAVTDDRAPDGGSFVPFKMPFFTTEQIHSLKDSSFNQVVADVLNAFFASRLSVWDVDLCVGKNPLRLREMNYRVLLAEVWHNPKGNYAYLEEKLCSRLPGAEQAEHISDWVHTTVRIAVLFGIYGQLCAQGYLKCGDYLDIAVSGEGFTAPMACFYARQMGLPINVILCAFENDSAAWDLIHRGTFGLSGGAVSLRRGIEKLISATLGDGAVDDFCQCVRTPRSYSVNAEQLKTLSEGFYCVVAGKNRAGATVNSIFRSNAYLVDPATALCYGGLQDYRSATGNSCITLMISERSPAHDIDFISNATGIQAEKLLEKMKP